MPLDRIFLHYGVQADDMEIIEQACRDNDINAEWLREYLLKPYNEKRSKSETPGEKEIIRILKNAIRRIPS